MVGNHSLTVAASNNQKKIKFIYKPTLILHGSLFPNPLAAAQCVNVAKIFNKILTITSAHIRVTYEMPSSSELPVNCLAICDVFSVKVFTDSFLLIFIITPITG